MSDDLHPNEIRVAVRALSGIFIPTREYEPLLVAARCLGPKHSEALAIQVQRQSTSCITRAA